MAGPDTELLGPARLVVTDRRGGVSRAPWRTLNLADHVGDEPDHVARNRRQVAVGLGVRDVAVVHANHSRTVHVVTAAGTAPLGDVLVTTTPGLALLVLSADCVAAALVAPDVPALAVVHAGWRGVALNAAGAAVEALVGLGADPAAVMARVGPTICMGCYEVSEQVRDEVTAASPAAGGQTRVGTPAVDVTAGFVWQLRAAGVQYIATDPRCTFQTEELYSYRRDGRTGRQGVMAVLGEP